MNRKLTLLLLLFMLVLTGCMKTQKYEPAIEEANSVEESLLETAEESPAENEASDEKMKEDVKEESEEMVLKIGDTLVPTTWESNESVAEIMEIAKEPLTVSMSMYGGFEQVGSIGANITRNDLQITTSPGDIVLYSGNQIVIFYGSNSWAYTMLGRIDLSMEELIELLGKGDVTITLEMGKEI